MAEPIEQIAVCARKLCVAKSIQKVSIIAGPF